MKNIKNKNPVASIFIFQSQEAHFKPSFLTALVSILVTAPCASAFAQDIFDTSMIQAGLPAGQSVDLTQFENSGTQLPGDYVTDIYINSTFFATRSLHFVAGDNNTLVPQLTVALLGDMGVNIGSVPALQGLPPSQVLTRLSDIPDAQLTFDFDQQRLDISIPQVNMDPDAGELADRSLWDEGIPALILNYNLSGSNTRTATDGTGGAMEGSTIFGGFSPGINAGAWRLRSQMSWSASQMHGNESDDSTSDFAVWDTALTRDIPGMNGELTLGESSTGADVFDSFSMRGVKLETNSEMYSFSQRGFAPVISGIARTHAQVTVSQNGNVIYQTYVAPGAFRLSSLNQAGTAGALVVTVKEADGTTHSQTIAYTSLPIMQRAGHLEYAFAAGQYSQGGSYQNTGQTPLFATGTLIYGLPHNMTAYGGLLTAENYLAGVVGTGVSLGMAGAVAADVTVAQAKLENQQGPGRYNSSGESFRVKYSKSMTTTGTTMNLAAYRYSTEGYYNFSDVNNQYTGSNSVWQGRRRSSWQGTVSQSFRQWGSLYLTTQRDDYWGSSKTTNRVTIGYNNNYNSISYSVNYSQDYTSNSGNSGVGEQQNRMVSVSLNIPLQLFTDGAMQGTYLNLSSSLDNLNQNRNSLGMSGSALDDSSLGYSVNESWGNQGQVAATSVNATYQGSRAQVQAGYNRDKYQQSLNYGVSGGILVHQYGVTLSRTLPDSMALVRAPGASGVKLMGTTNIWTDNRGYAVMPYLSNYRQNTVMLDPSELPEDTEISEAGKRVYPTRGAVVLADYNVQQGQQILLVLRYQGKPVPFGASAVLQGTEKGKEVSGIVDDGGRVYLAGLSDRGVLKVNWGQSADRQCTVNFTLPPPEVTPKEQNASLRTVEARCE
ncbi:MAG TPA: fimbria/pilus outer membrane usher protein [Scandinavium sp.]|jgi:outer membrane usher protein